MLHQGRWGLFLGGCLALCGCGSARSVDVVDRQPVENPVIEPERLETPPVDPSPVETASPASGAEPVLAAEIDALIKIPRESREEISLLAHSTLHLQRVALLQESQIQQELRLSPQEIEQFTKLAKDVEQMRSTLQTMSVESRKEKLRNEYQPKTVEYQHLVDAALDDAEERLLFRRVLQRQRGAIIFLLPGVPEELNLTAAQQAFLYELIDTTRQSVNLDNLNSPLEMARIYMKANAARKKAEEQLTPEQRQIWDQLLAD